MLHVHVPYSSPRYARQTSRLNHCLLYFCRCAPCACPAPCWSSSWAPSWKASFCGQRTPKTSSSSRCAHISCYHWGSVHVRSMYVSVHVCACMVLVDIFNTPKTYPCVRTRKQQLQTICLSPLSLLLALFQARSNVLYVSMQWDGGSNLWCFCVISGLSTLS